MPAKQVPFHITSGIPFAKTVLVTLPNGRTWWTDESNFEVLCQVRESDSVDSDLILDLAQFLTVTFVPGTDPDLVTIDLTMSGTETRFITKSGHYDMVMSDAFAVDDRAIVIINGPVQRYSLVSAASEETP